MSNTPTPEETPESQGIYDRIPTLKDLTANGGIPGLEYLLVYALNKRKSYDEGWRQVADIHPLSVNGVPAELVARGEPILTGRPGSTICPYFVDFEIQQPQPEESAEVPEPKPEVKAKPASPKKTLATAPAT